MYGNISIIILLIFLIINWIIGRKKNITVKRKTDELAQSTGNPSPLEELKTHWNLKNRFEHDSLIKLEGEVLSHQITLEVDLKKQSILIIHIKPQVPYPGHFMITNTAQYQKTDDDSNILSIKDKSFLSSSNLPVFLGNLNCEFFTIYTDLNLGNTKTPFIFNNEGIHLYLENWSNISFQQINDQLRKLVSLSNIFETSRDTVEALMINIRTLKLPEFRHINLENLLKLNVSREILDPFLRELLDSEDDGLIFQAASNLGAEGAPYLGKYLRMEKYEKEAVTSLLLLEPGDMLSGITEHFHHYSAKIQLKLIGNLTRRVQPKEVRGLLPLVDSRTKEKGLVTLLDFIGKNGPKETLNALMTLQKKGGTPLISRKTEKAIQQLMARFDLDRSGWLTLNDITDGGELSHTTGEGSLTMKNG